ncbi:helix-turn-helix domain-containing protein [Klebsiella grimontii]|nr:helix-turn-helix domain-containing protein [Klebsiella grimontii]
MAYNNHHNKKTNDEKSEHHFSYVIKNKPINTITSLCLALLPYGQEILLKKNKCYRLNEEKEGVGIILVINGLVAAIDSHSGIYTHTLYPPTIVGLIHGLRAFNEMSGPMKNILIAETDATLVFVPLQVFIDKVDNDNLWHDVAKILAHRLMAMKSKEREFLSTDAYRIIKTLIQEVWFYPEEYRKHINLPHFILKHSGLSRSRIMKILRGLKEGGYIDIVHGKLISVNKLPSSY